MCLLGTRQRSGPYGKMVVGHVSESLENSEVIIAPSGQRSLVGYSPWGLQSQTWQHSTTMYYCPRALSLVHQLILWESTSPLQDDVSVVTGCPLLYTTLLCNYSLCTKHCYTLECQITFTPRSACMNVICSEITRSVIGMIEICPKY